MTEFKEFKMNIYLLSQNVSHGYDTFDAMVVAADDVIEAKTLSMEKAYGADSWTDKYGDITAKIVGYAVIGTSKGVLLGSFHAG